MEGSDRASADTGSSLWSSRTAESAGEMEPSGVSVTNLASSDAASSSSASHSHTAESAGDAEPSGGSASADRAPADAASSSLSPSRSRTAESAGNTELSSGGSASNSAAIDPVVEEEESTEGDEAGHHPELIRQMTSVSYSDAIQDSTENGEHLRLIRDETWSCVVVILTFWLFVSVTMVLGVYGSSNLLLGPNSSILLRPNPLFVQYIRVVELEEAANQPTLYGFYETPPLDVVTTWSETHKTSLNGRSHEEWIYYLNQGSQMNVSYIVNSQGSSPLVLVIAQGNEGFSQWLEDPSYPNSTLSWNTIDGSGMIRQDMYMPSFYYVAVANLNSEAVEFGGTVELNVKIRAFLYNTSEAYYKCSLSKGECNLELFFNRANAAVLTSPAPTHGGGGDQLYVNLSYGPRWMTYIAGIGMLTVVMVGVFHLLNNFNCGHRRRLQFRDMQSTRTPLLPNKDDDLSSWGSSYDSASQNDEDLEDVSANGPGEGKPTKDGEYNNTRRLCAICFDAPRDCFFLPCGHCVACFACGTRIAEAAGTCPICRRHMKKVRKIFTV